MKYLLFIITLIFCTSTYAQEEYNGPKLFVRVYNLYGKKIEKGKVYKCTDTTLVLKRNKGFVEIPVSRIGSIKTKRSGGSNVLIGALTGATAMAIIKLAEDEPRNDFVTPGIQAADRAFSGASKGALVGAAIGGITILFKNSKSYEINGDEVKWKAFQDMITR